MQITLSVATSIRICMASALLLMLSVPAQADLPKAAMDDYVWEVLDKPVYPNWGENCSSEDERIYQDCLDKSLMIYNQRLIKKWGLSEYISRKLNKTIIKVPNHDLIILMDDFAEGEKELRYVYLLDHYDADNNWLYLSGQIYETNNTVLIDLDSGFKQEFEGSHLTFSPDMTYAATVKVEFPGEENVMIWKKDKSDAYQYDEKNNRDYDKFRQHLKFYNGSEDKVRKVEVEWITNESLLVDFYFKMNDSDTAAYRVRFNYVKTDSASDWQMIPIK
ncbi:MULTISPECIES: hypothetical protein [unclassified Psychrobacter]|uniref:hypothetical protein n=1 Tax=unclassified Psychrobacter TaxID=196806 RepID=UPI00191AE4CC|nr:MULTISPECIES: hypothetical protein [unclassified Psychrobacter]MCG3809582.1 hypothetical protein [Psychrobacter sp. Ps4]